MRFERFVDVDLRKGHAADIDLGPVLFEGDNNSMRLGVRLYGTPGAVAITGNISAWAIVSTGQTISPIDAVGKNDNSAWVDVPQNALVPGRIEVFLRITDGDEYAVSLHATATVRRTQTGEIIVPGDPLPNVDSMRQIAQECVEATEAAEQLVDSSVSYSEQTGKTDAEKAQARTNIGAASEVVETAMAEHFPATGKLQAGVGTSAAANGAVATGVGTTASGRASHAEGQLTTADGQVAHAEGYGTTASGDYSHAEGFGTKASGDYQHAVGKYNAEDTNDTYLEIAGNGTGDNARSNARTLDWNGNETLAGDLTVNKGGAGEMVLGQEVSSLKSAIIRTITITSDDVLDGYRRGSDGIITTGNTYKCTKLLPLDGAFVGGYAIVTTVLISNAGMAFFDEGGNYLSGYNWDTLKPSGGRYGLNTGLKVAIPNGAYYVSTSLNADSYTDASSFSVQYSCAKDNTAAKQDRRIDKVNDYVSAAMQSEPNNIMADSVWTIGTLTTDGGEGDATSRIRNTDYISVIGYDILQISVDSGYQVAIHFYDFSKTHVADVAYTADTTINIPATAAYVRCAILNSNSSTAAVSWADHIAVNASYSASKPINLMNGITWNLGTIGSGGTEIEVSSRIRTNEYVPIKGLTGLLMQIVPEYAFGYILFDSDKTVIGNAAYFEGARFLTVPPDACYIRITIKNNHTDSASTGWGSYFTMLGCGELYGNIDKLVLETNGAGDHPYTGRKVVLTDENQQQNRCQISLWKDFKGADISNITNYKLHLAQSMTIYGNYVFLLSEEGVCTVLNYSTKAILGKFALPLTTGCHYNSAMFSDIFYSAGDTFPLLFSSRCMNNGTDPDMDACLVLRITLTDGEFASTLVNKIVSDVETYNCNWVVDNNNRTITQYGYPAGGYNVETNNPVVYNVWTLPQASGIISGTTVTLNKVDIVGHYEHNHLIFQGADVKHGVIYTGMQPVSGGRYIYGVDVLKGEIVTVIPLMNQTLEIEGVAVYNGKMYVEQKEGTDTAGTNPLKIYEIVF